MSAKENKGQHSLNLCTQQYIQPTRILLDQLCHWVLALSPKILPTLRYVVTAYQEASDKKIIVNFGAT